MATKVPVENSQADIRRSVMKYLERGYTISEVKDDEGVERAIVEFRREGVLVRISAEVPPPDMRKIDATARRARSRSKDEIEFEAREQLRRETWRSIALGVDARLRAVDAGVSTFEQAFMADIVIDEAIGETLYERLKGGGQAQLSAGSLS